MGAELLDREQRLAEKSDRDAELVARELGAAARNRWRMRQSSTPARFARVAIPCAAVIFAACGDSGGSLSPEGPAADAIAWTWWLMLGLGTAIFLVVVALLIYALIRSDQPDSSPSRLGNVRLVIAGGILLPIFVLPVLWIVTVATMADIAEPESEPELSIEIVAHQWWYEVSYPEHGIWLENEMVIPAAEPVSLRLTASDVIHSFWVPRLAGKVDMIPGKENDLWIEARKPGEYRVQCAEFCGLFHAVMQMKVQAVPLDEFERWLREQGRTQAPPEVEP